MAKRVYDDQIVIEIEEAGLFAQLQGNFPITPIRQLTSFPRQGAFFEKNKGRSRWRGDGRTHLMRPPGKRVPFYKAPVGLLSVIIDCLQERGIGVEIIDNRKILKQAKLSRVNLHGVTLRDYQREGVEAAVRSGRGIIKMATGAGKTYIAAAIAQAYGKRFRTLFLVRGLNLLYQTRRKFAEYLRLEEEQIGVIGDSNFDPGRWITIASPDTIFSRMREGYCKDFLNSIQVLMLDECHNTASSQFFKVLLKCPAPVRIAMSGTPLDRSDGQDLKLISQTGPVISEVSNKYLIEHGYSVEVIVNYTEVTQPIIPDNATYPEAYSLGVVNNSYRNGLIRDKVEERLAEGRQVWVLVKQIKHGELLSDLLKSIAIDHSFICGRDSVQKREKVLDQFRRGALPVIISNKILEQGIDVPSVDALILAVGDKTKIGALQRLGRGVRTGGRFDNLVVDEFLDMTHPLLTKHSLIRFQVYKKEDAFTLKLAS